MDNDSILQQLEEANPDVLLVAFGNPKQEKWLAKHRKRLRVPVCIGVGASIDFLSGKQSRAPIWMQQAGLEWSHRLLNDPRPLASRYLGNGLFLRRYISAQILAHSLQPRSSNKSRLSMSRHADMFVADIHGDFNGQVTNS